ncbi:VOC family protein [Virgibacillus senegalensis]|uniref:VOC family protein n=1 Tax=Virgibacillus senegalensis TaxID=1499679 RepID=UPI00069EBAD8|nr:VOC family protein [Virgibacillus senegalensis]
MAEKARKSNPIKNRINTIFVHVNDLERSVTWYSQLLHQEVDLTQVSKPVHNLQMDQYTGLTLDAGPEGETKKIAPSPYPLFNFHTEDIQESYQYIQELGYKVESDIIEEFEDFSFFTISDPDGHVIMICNG